MKKTYTTPSMEISLFETEDILTASQPGVIVKPPVNGGSEEVGGGVDIQW